MAQAFHWFDRPKFKQECQRILKNNGKVVLVWNIRNYRHDIVKKDYTIREKFSVGDAKGLSSEEKPINVFDNFFINGEYEELTFANDLLLKRDDYIGMNLSRSYAPDETKHPNKHHGFVADLNKIFDEYSDNGILRYPHVTKGYVGRV